MFRRLPVVTAYGPRVTEARVLEVAAAMRDCALMLEFQAREAPVGSCVVHGRARRLARVVQGVTPDAAQIEGIDAADGGEPWGWATVPRAELAAWLRAEGREGDAAKVAHGPPDQPEPPGTRLLVCLVDDACVAVTWSHPMGEDRVMDLRRLV